jgi:hypothetical protein
MLQVFTDANEEFSFGIFIIDERLCKKTILFIKQNFGYELEATDDDEDFTEIGEFLVDTLLIRYKDFSEDWLELGSKINLHIIP